jgi:hypothetical protein
MLHAAQQTKHHARTHPAIVNAFIDLERQLDLPAGLGR